jgi:hypothetical protein
MTKKSISIAISLIFFLLFFSPKSITAQEGRSISVVPPKFELFANPGDIVTERIKISNNSVVVSTYSILIEDFGSTGEEGQVVLEEEGADTKYSLASWIEPAEREIILQPNEEKTLVFNINVPRDAEPGGHYASLLLQSAVDQNAATEGGAAAQVSQRIGNLVLLRVSGNISESAQIETFEAPAISKTVQFNFTLKKKNDGNVHIRPKGTIIITDLFGRKVDELPLEGANVLPGATRKMDTAWEKENLLGSYTATLVATYGQQSLPLTAATKFNVISNTTLVIGSIAMIALIIFLISLVSGRGRLKKALKALTQG